VFLRMRSLRGLSIRTWFGFCARKNLQVELRAGSGFSGWACAGSV